MIDYLTKLNIKPDESAEQPCSSIISSARSSIIWENNTMNEILLRTENYEKLKELFFKLKKEIRKLQDEYIILQDENIALREQLNETKK